jgi:hypothetical protein
VAQVVVPSSLFIGAVALITGEYDAPTALFLNGVLGSDTWTLDWQFWFLEALVWTSLGAVALMAVPALDRVERRRPFAFAGALLLATLALRLAWTGVEAGPTERYTPGVVFWCFALGWVAARSRTTRQRVAVLLAAAAAYAGFFGDWERELLVVAGVAALLWVPALRVPRILAPVISTRTWRWTIRCRRCWRPWRWGSPTGGSPAPPCGTWGPGCDGSGRRSRPAPVS